MPVRKISINRAPVLTLWAVTVAERLGYERAAALTLGKAVAGLNAQSKGQRLGIFKEASEETKAGRQSKKLPPGKQLAVTLMGRAVPAVQTTHGLRATAKDEVVDPEGVLRYLEKKFGADLADAQAAMQALAKAFPPEQLAAQAYALYEKFRPTIAEGKKGWGAAGELDLDEVRALARKKG